MSMEQINENILDDVCALAINHFFIINDIIFIINDIKLRDKF